MRKIPSPPATRIDIAIAKMLKDNEELRPQMLLLYKHAALMKREQYQAFVDVGFTSEQAYQLCNEARK